MNKFNLRFDILSLFFVSICTLIGCQNIYSYESYPEKTMKALNFEGKSVPYVIASHELPYREICYSNRSQLSSQIIKYAAPEQAYLLLVLFSKHCPSQIECITDDRKADILTSAIKRHATMDDWGHWDYEIDNTFSTKLLIDCGESAIPYLHKLLFDVSEARVSFRDSAVWRKCDYAAFILSQIIGGQYPFDASVSERDIALDNIKKQVKRNYKIPKKSYFD